MSDQALAQLPHGMHALAEAVGWVDALLLARSYGGIEIYLAERPGASNAVLRAIGAEATERLVAAFGPGWLLVPMLPNNAALKRRLIHRLLRAGEAQVTVARAVQVHQRTVRRYAKAIEGGPRRGRLMSR